MVVANITLHGSVYPCGPAQNKNYDEAKCVKRHVGTQEAKEPFKLTETRTEMQETKILEDKVEGQCRGHKRQKKASKINCGGS